LLDLFEALDQNVFAGDLKILSEIKSGRLNLSGLLGHMSYRDGSQVFSLRARTGMETLTRNHETNAAIPFGGTGAPNYPVDKRPAYLRTAPWLLLSVEYCATNAQITKNLFGFDYVGESDSNSYKCRLRA
jgi:hypothetical protein